MKRRIKKIEAFETPIGMGLAYIEPVPTYHPPSLPERPEPKATKLMQRLLKQNEEEFRQFRHRLLLKLPKTVMPMVNVANFDPSPLNLPPLFGASEKPKRKTKKSVLYHRRKS